MCLEVVRDFFGQDAGLKSPDVDCLQTVLKGNFDTALGHRLGNPDDVVKFENIVVMDVVDRHLDIEKFSLAWSSSFLCLVVADDLAAHNLLQDVR